jgi:hypothetical protein
MPDKMRQHIIRAAKQLPKGSEERRRVLAMLKEGAALRVRPDLNAVKRSNGQTCPFCGQDTNGKYVYETDTYGSDDFSTSRMKCENCGAVWTAIRKVTDVEIDDSPDGEPLSVPAKPGSPLAKLGF